MISEVYAQLRSLLTDIAAVYALAAIAGVIVVVFVSSFLTEFFRFHGPCIVLCPKTHEPAVVEVDALHVAVGRLVGEKDLRLMTCSRREDSRTCARECLKDLR